VFLQNSFFRIFALRLRAHSEIDKISKKLEFSLINFVALRASPGMRHAAGRHNSGMAVDRPARDNGVNMNILATRVLLGTAAAVMLSGMTPPAVADSNRLPASIETSKTITYCSAMTLPPVTFVNAQQQPQGFDVEFGDMLAGRLGLKTKWINVAFSGIVPALLAGQCDAIVSALYIQPARLKIVDEIPYMYVSQSVLLKAGTPKLESIDDLSGRKVAAVTGSTTTVLLDATNKELVKAGKTPMTIVMFPENSEALQQLQLGYVDAFGVQYETATYYSNLQPGQFELGIAPYYKIPVGIGLMKNQPELESAIKSEVAAMIKDGSYAAELKKWGLSGDALTP
jgi:polar amino acid transport system substrate-binding protein